MEVPHHSHDHKSAKNWKSYIGEFLMLFLAVFSGFIAENLREGYVEKERAHEYVASMVSDLQKDTTQITRVIRMNRKMIKGIDSLLFYFAQPASDSSIKKVYIFSSSVGASVLFEGETGTMAQLKNSGGLRLIKDTASAAAITGYDQLAELVKKQGDAYYRTTMEILNLMEQSMDFYKANHKPSPSYFLSTDPALLRLFYNKCFVQKKIIDNYCNNLEIQKAEAVRSIVLLRKKYHLSE